ncbi:MAG: 2-dehydropantoate 2-reductase N-terminal domain-containing protein, partial [Pseudomonadota bacterium]
MAGTYETIGIVGGGAWGTALGQSLAKAGHAPLLWANEAETVADINDRNTNATFLDGVQLAPTLTATGDLAEIAARNVILLVPPAQHLRAVVKALVATDGLSETT